MSEKNAEVRKRSKVFRDAERLKYQRRHSRRNFLLGGAALGVAVLAGYGLFSLRQGSERAAVETKLAEYKLASLKTDAVIAQTDQAFAWLKNTLSGKTKDDKDRQALMTPIVLHEANTSNPQRNAYRYLIEDLEKRGKEALEKGTTFKPANPSFYFFRSMEGVEGNFVGAFTPGSRTLGISAAFRSDNIYDVLVAYHETEHAVQDTEFRARAEKANLWALYWDIEQHGAIIGSNEQKAYIKEMLVFDALTDGRLKTDALSGKFDLDWYVKFLNAPSSQRGFIDGELEFAREMFKSGSTTNNIAPSFAEFVNYQYRGRPIVEITPDNRVLQVNK